MSTAHQPPSLEDTFGRFTASGPQWNILRTLVKSNADDAALATYVGTLSSLQAAGYREEALKQIAGYREEILRLQGDLNTAKAMYSGEGLLSMRDIMEYIQRTMPDRTDVKWVGSQAKTCWQSYVEQRPSLKECLNKRRLAVDNVGEDLVDVYKTLSEKIHDSQTPTEYQKSDSVLYIGAPLVQKQRELIACLCEDVQVAYQVMPATPVVGPNEA
ncbi:hypothetical protein HXX76_000911 [Chlamydomonas incerta]|uniref:Uncharacterized protein n=1 Tax=Chlamydomonas incerta TaxID=51695 RepID=A0A835WF73_CHLIN|nr:hypothetical protein HXX76_000911 [Chlamydomonas incerta]|eukprot:KAG2446323.1 hypothetical protein HXX76_000911 [Chlamydomonas incerta]